MKKKYSKRQPGITAVASKKERIRVYDETEGILEAVDPKEERYKKRDIENRASFQRRLAGLSVETAQLIDFAYDLGKEAHRPQWRDTGERYFEHLRSVALILMDECGIMDPDIIVAALLHDSVEDSAIFGNAHLPYSKWKITTRFRLGLVFDPEVAEMVIALTKPKVDGEKIKTKSEARSLYLKNLADAPAKTVLIKMADRLHNLRTLAGTPREKRIRVVKETKGVYYPLFQKALVEYPKESRHLLKEMANVIAKLKLQ